MSTANFVISFEGPGLVDGSIDVRDLAPALLSLTQAIDAANLAINGESVPARIRVVATGVGSFEIGLNLVLSGWESMKGLLLTPDGQAAATLLALLGFTVPDGLVGLYRWIRSRKIESVTAHGSAVTIKIGDEVLTVPLEVLRLYRDLAVSAALSDLLDTLESERVEKISFKTGRGLPPTQTLTRADRHLVQVEPPPDETVVDDTRRMALSIRSLTFQEGNKWRLYDGQNTITAAITDADFLTRVDRNELRFAKADVLICLVQTIQRQGVEGLKTEHVVQRVLEYRPAPQQITLPLNPP